MLHYHKIQKHSIYALETAVMLTQIQYIQDEGMWSGIHVTRLKSGTHSEIVGYLALKTP